MVLVRQFTPSCASSGSRGGLHSAKPDKFDQMLVKSDDETCLNLTGLICFSSTFSLGLFYPEFSCYFSVTVLFLPLLLLILLLCLYSNLYFTIVPYLFYLYFVLLLKFGKCSPSSQKYFTVIIHKISTKSK